MGVSGFLLELRPDLRLIETCPLKRSPQPEEAIMAHTGWCRAPLLKRLLDHGLAPTGIALTLLRQELVAKVFDPRLAARGRYGRSLDLGRGDRLRFRAKVQNAAVDPVVNIKRSALRIV